MFLSQDTLPNTIIAFGITILFILFAWQPRLKRIMVPFFKKGNTGRIGFVTLTQFLSFYGFQRGYAYYKFLLPLFTTTYVFWLAFIDYVSSANVIDDENYLYYIAGMWFVVMLTTGQVKQMLLFVLVLFGGAFLISKSIYWSFVVVAIFLGISFANSYDDVYVFRLASSEIRAKDSMRLDGSKVNKIFATVRYRLRILAPIFMAFTVIRLITNSVVTSSSFSLSYVTNTTSNIVVIIPLLIIFLNHSLTIFTGGIYDYFQVDLFANLGKAMRFQQTQPEDFEHLDNSISNLPAGRVLTFNYDDRIPDLEQMPASNFKKVLAFYSLDVFLTLATILGVPLISGGGAEGTATLSSLIKIPLYAVFLLKSAVRLNAKRMGSSELARQSITYQEHLTGETHYLESAKLLLKKIIHQQILTKNDTKGENLEDKYIDAKDNLYLLWLADVPYLKETVDI